VIEEERVMCAKQAKGAARAGAVVPVGLTLGEVEDLVRLARQYEKSMGVSRYFVRFASGPEMRARFRFVAQESEVLEAFARAQLENARGTDSEYTVEFLPRALVAFWGRTLSSLGSERSRRKMNRERLAVRKSVDAKLEAAVRDLYTRDREFARSEIATRREREVAWMQERLEA
jgi:hypothetical protein